MWRDRGRGGVGFRPWGGEETVGFSWCIRDDEKSRRHRRELAREVTRSSCREIARLLVRRAVEREAPLLLKLCMHALKFLPASRAVDKPRKGESIVGERRERSSQNRCRKMCRGEDGEGEMV